MDNGKALERLVRQAGQILTDTQKAKIWKIPNDLRLTSSGEAVWGDQNPCDFIGHSLSGRAILIECKAIGGLRLALGSRGLKPHQWIALQEAHDAGAIALVIWGRSKKVAVLDMDMIRSLTKERRSIAWKQIPERYVRDLGVEGIVDLLVTHHVQT